MEALAGPSPKKKTNPTNESAPPQKKAKAPDVPHQPIHFDFASITEEIGRERASYGRPKYLRSHDLSQTQEQPPVGAGDAPFPLGQHISRQMGTSNDDALRDPYSQTSLSERHAPRDEAAKWVFNRYVVPLRKLYSFIANSNSLNSIDSSGNQDLDIGGDFVVFGVLAEKGHLRICNKDGQRYISWTLLDMRNEQTTAKLYLFEKTKTSRGSFGLFEEWHKRKPGSVLALLNPQIKRHDDGKLSLKPISKESMANLGTAADIGLCKSIKADGERCRHWCNLRRSQFCSHHITNVVSSLQTGRPELAGSTVSFRDVSRRDEQRGLLHSRPQNQTSGLGKSDSGALFAPTLGRLRTGEKPHHERRSFGSDIYIHGGSRKRSFNRGHDDETFIDGVTEGPTVKSVNEKAIAKVMTEEQNEQAILRILQSDQGRTAAGLQFAKAFAAPQSAPVVDASQSMVGNKEMNSEKADQ